MELNIRGEIEINGIKIDATKLIIKDGKVKAYTNYAENSLKDIKQLRHGNLTIIKDGKLALKCNNHCKDCPMCEDARLEVYTNPNTFRIMWGYRCSNKGTYSETLEKLPTSKIKSEHEIELKRAYEQINDKFARRRTKYVTDETIKMLISEIDDALTPNMYEHYNEYGHERIELETVEIRKNKYGYTLWYDGRMGDYGLSSTIYLNKKCDVDAVIDALKSRYYRKYRTDFRKRL